MLTLDVVVRTLADRQRSSSLFHALDSIQHQQGMIARPIVVVNGRQFDARVMDALRARHGILLHYEPKASTGIAVLAGRKLVTAPCFAYLDDDDELIDESLRVPMEWLDRNPRDDAIITNGYFVRPTGRLEPSSHLTLHMADPALGLLSECWLSPGAFIFRTASIREDMMGADWNQMEWSKLAFELCARHAHIHFMDAPTVRYNDTPGSMSKGFVYREANLRLLRSVRSDNRLPKSVRRGAARKYLRSQHDLIIPYLAANKRKNAWQCHTSSLRPPYTFKYLLFTRKLLWSRRPRQ
jgi:hypothetical protein